MYLQQENKFFVKNWQEVRTGPVIMSYVESYKMPLIETPSRNSSSPQVSTKEKGKMIVQEEIEEMLKKKVIAPVQNKPKQYVCSILIALKKYSGF